MQDKLPAVSLGLLFTTCLGLAAAFGADRGSTVDRSQPAGAAQVRPAYAIFIRERSRDAAELKTYTQKAPASLANRDAQPLAVYGRLETLEGPAAEGVVVVRFPSLQAARDWYDSPAYREARKHRFLGADYRAFLVEGL